MTFPGSRRDFLKLSSSLAVGAVLGPVSLLARPRPPLRLVERAAFTMGSIATIKAYCTDEALCSEAIDAAFHEMKTIDKLMSVFDEKSQLSFVNRHGWEREVRVDPRIIEVVEHAQRYCEVTNGAFDTTIEPLMEMYGFRDDKATHRFPTDIQIAHALEAVGMSKVSSNCQLSTVNFEHPSTQLDFGGIAVGYAIDRAVSILRSRGIESAIVNHSGDIFALGAPPGEESWKVGIIDPMKTSRLITRTRIRDQALSTSGNYENFIKVGNSTIGHILNPANGRTAEAILSGTVIASSATEADALSTGFFVLGTEKANHVVGRMKNVKFIVVVRDGEGETVMGEVG